MISDVEPDRDREIPGFVAEWRAEFEGGGEGLSPLDYIGINQALPFAIASQWLFCPNFAEYRGCVVAIKYGDDGTLTDEKRANVDRWYEYFHGDIPNTEAKVNLLHIPGRFGLNENDPYEQYLPALARSVARCWEGLLAVQFPDRRFTVAVHGDSPDELDPEITFYTTTPSR